MHNIKLVIEYDGINYCGWQVQRIKRRMKDEGRWTKRRISIQGTIENCLEKILREKVHLTASGRTDSGVHALGQIANFKAASKMLPEKIKSALNGNLPKDIVITNAEYVPLDFHSRFSAKSKTYRYLILNQFNRTPFLQNNIYWIKAPLNTRLMKKAAGNLLGRHNFKSFCASGSNPERIVLPKPLKEGTNVENTIRTIKNISIGTLRFLSYKLICIEIEADGFLYNMVRNIAGTLVEVGRGRFKPDYIKELLKKNDRKLAGACAPARGLFLVKVKY